MEIEVERFLALTAMLAGFVPTTGAAAERDAGAEREAADEGVDEA